MFDKDFHGRWSLKKAYLVLIPGADPDSVHVGDGVITYDDLDGCAKGDEAAMMLLEYLRPGTAPERRTEVRRQLLRYCELDTGRLWRCCGCFGRSAGRADGAEKYRMDRTTSPRLRTVTPCAD